MMLLETHNLFFLLLGRIPRCDLLDKAGAWDYNWNSVGRFCSKRIPRTDFVCFNGHSTPKYKNNQFIICRFVLVSAGVVYLYFSNFQSVDEEEYGGTWELMKEGFMTSFAGFLVSII